VATPIVTGAGSETLCYPVFRELHPISSPARATGRGICAKRAHCRQIRHIEQQDKRRAGLLRHAACQAILWAAAETGL